MLSAKFLILYVLIASALYVHLRGKVRHKFFRQLLDHSTFMAPINALMYCFSAIPNKPFVEQKHFPALTLLRENWQTIREEAQNLVAQGYIKAADNRDDAAFNSFFRTGWKRFYLTWYGTHLPSAQELCPKTMTLLTTIPSIKGAMFALLPKNGRLGKHRDPYAGSLRYHLGLITPNSEKCRIYVDGIPYHWKDGEDVLFDETYIHSAKNETEIDRIILFCDVERPLKNKIMTKINRWFSKYVMSGSLARNLATERVGFINKVFKYLYTIHSTTRGIKKTNRKLYYGVKYALLLIAIYFIFIYNLNL